MRVIVELTTNYRVASIIKLIGFGISVIQRLCKTSVKKNLYWEVKDKVIEESFNGVRMEKRPKRVKVYGLDSTKDVRARLIEILMERTMYHKDKFVAPILHNEMKSMQVKKSGKVEHSDNSHDDQVFSYLMALYVWYDGKNLMENFGIRKSVLKTDTYEELEENAIEDQLESREKVDFKSATFESNEEIARELTWIEQDAKTFKTSEDLMVEQYLQSVRQRNIILASDPVALKKIEEEDGVNSVSYNTVFQYNQMQLPDELFMMNTDDRDDDMVDLFSEDEQTNQPYSVLQGNLSKYW